MYGLIPEENYTVPPEAEGLEPATHETLAESVPTVLQKSRGEAGQEQGHIEGGVAGSVNIATGHTTKRHRHTMSSDTASIATVIEENEDEEKSEVVEEDSTELETPVAVQQSEHSAFASAVEGHPATPEEKEPEEVEAALSSLTLAEPVEEPEVAPQEEEQEEEQETAAEPADEPLREDPENEVAEPTEAKEVAQQSEQPEETTNAEEKATEAEEPAKDTGD